MTTTLLQSIATMLAAAASLVGVVLAVGQLSAAARLRRRATFWSDQLQAAELAHDKAILQSFHRGTLARLAALSAYPGTKLVIPASLVVSVMYGIGAAGHFAGTLGASFAWDTLYEQGLDPFLLLASVPILPLGLLGVASIFVRRRQIAHQYLEARDLSLIRPDESGDELTVGLKLSNRTYLGVFSFSLGILLLVAAFSFVAGLPKGDPSVLSAVGGWFVFPVMAATPITLLSVWSVISLFKQGSEAWKHPRPLSDAAREPFLDPTDGADDAKRWTARLLAWARGVVERRNQTSPDD